MKDPQQPLTPALLQHMDHTMETYHHDSSRLLEILLEIQREVPRQYIPQAAAYYIAEKLNLKITQVYDVISFFSALHAEPRAKYPIQICSSIVCKVNQSDIILETLQDLLGIGLNQVTYDGKFTLEEVPCFGACDAAPAVRINGQIYGHLTTREKIADVIEHLE